MSLLFSARARRRFVVVVYFVPFTQIRRARASTDVPSIQRGAWAIWTNESYDSIDETQAENDVM